MEYNIACLYDVAMMGKAGIDAFTELRWITIATQPGHFPI